MILHLPNLTKKMMQNFILRSFTRGAPYALPDWKSSRSIQLQPSVKVESRDIVAQQQQLNLFSQHHN